MTCKKHCPGDARRGRPAEDGSTDVKRTTVTLTDDDRRHLTLLGGSVWVRGAIRKAVKEKGWSKPAK